MRRIRSALLPSLGVLLAFALAPPAHAGGYFPSYGGLNLTWSRCHGEGVGTQNRAFACETNDGSEVLVASFVLNAPLAHVSGNEIVIDLISQDDAIPMWWDFKNPGTCRLTSLRFNTVADANNVVCADWAQGNSMGGVGAYTTGTPASMGGIDPALVPRHRRAIIALAVPPTALADLQANTEYFTCNLVIDHAKTVGTGACAGCAGSVCILLQAINITTPIVASNMHLYGATTPGSDMAHWQGSGADCNLVPTRRETWGAVKALYR